MVRLSSAALGMVLGAVAGVAVADDAKELARFDGTWVIASTTVDGTQLDPDEFKGYTQVIKAGKARTLYKGKEREQGTYKIVDATKTPAQVDVTIDDGPSKGTVLKGIYKFDGENLVICLGGLGKDRPTTFESKKGSGAMLSTLHRHETGRVVADDVGAAEVLKKLEQQWVEAYVKRDTAFLERLLPEDYAITYPDGSVLNKKREIADIKSGAVALTELKIGEMLVRTYGDAAVITGQAAIKGKVNGQDVSGDYRFTDTWVKRGEHWQPVASQLTRIVKP
jgi:uncharacterized protein (TIGR03067 family)